MQLLTGQVFAINPMEVAVVLLTCLIWLRPFFHKGAAWDISLGSVLLGAVFVVATILTAKEATQYLTVDDQVFADQILSPVDRGISQWAYGAFHTGLLVLVPIARVGEVAGLSPVAIHMLLKAVWLLVGLNTMVLISLQASFLIGRDRRTPSQSLFVATILILLPINNLAFKTLNYDLLSFSLAIYGAVLAARAVTRGRFPILGIVFAALAAQEKLSASPILLLIIIAASVFTDLSSKDHARQRFMSGVLMALRGLATAAAVTIFSMVFFAWIGPSSPLPEGFWWSWSDALVSWTWAPLMFLGGGTAFLEHRALVAGGCFTLILGMAGIARILWPAFERSLARQNWVPLAVASMCILMMCGAIGLLQVRAWWSPYHPNEASTLRHYFPVNGVVIHFDEHTVAQHYIRHFLYSATIALVSIPTVLSLTLVMSLLFGRDILRRFHPLVAIFAVYLIVQIVAATALNVPVSNRYINIGLAGVGLIAALISVAALERSRLAFAIAGPMIIVAIILELLPFRPSFAAFRPFWVEYPSGEHTEPGGLNPSWVGWGEEVMLAGKQIEEDCIRNSNQLNNVSCADIKLRPVRYYGRWLPGPKIINVVPTFPVGDPSTMTDRDYYVIGRLPLMQGMIIPKISPEYALTARGYTLGWVWRGDRLREAGFKAEP
ncbi:hypothetical protein [Microvirga rosea]|uniref:hypothetical protein n=1 Tax=Microvirga rosea TaxID=2715425 RepID=UPI001D0BB964|nr:hypothetical protein [Microvirga rosea]MCB8820199.1 hypothetical protein [Microvirga rosea]